MRLTHLVASAGCASKLGQAQLSEILATLPRAEHPSLLVGFETSDDAGVFLLPSGQAVVQTMDFFTPIVDDPYSYGQIAAANALSDVYAMGGQPVTTMNVSCFDPASAPPEVWASVLRGMHDKTVEAGAVCVGGHSVVDSQPKFGMSVTGLVDPDTVWSNKNATVGDEIWLSKSLGTGIVTTAAKFDQCTEEELSYAVASMVTLNAKARDAGAALGTVRCATDITGFSLAGHLFNIARASQVRIELDSTSLPVLPGVERMVADGCVTGGGARNEAFLGGNLSFSPNVPDWLRAIVFDPQTSGGLALFSKTPVPGCTKIGRVVAGDVGIVVS